MVFRTTAARDTQIRWLTRSGLLDEPDIPAIPPQLNGAAWHTSYYFSPVFGHLKTGKRPAAAISSLLMWPPQPTTSSRAF